MVSDVVTLNLKMRERRSVLVSEFSVCSQTYLRDVGRHSIVDRLKGSPADLAVRVEVLTDKSGRVDGRVHQRSICVRDVGLDLIPEAGGSGREDGRRSDRGLHHDGVGEDSIDATKGGDDLE